MSCNGLEPPCVDRGCGDNVSRQLGAEKRALLFKTTPNNSACRRLVYSRTPSTEIPPPSELKKCRKATSLEDLSPRPEENAKATRRRPMQMPSPKLQIANTSSVPAANAQVYLRNIPSTNIAGKQVCLTLMLNAWRRRRNDVLHLTINVQTLETQVDNLNLQTIVLRRLLDSEKERVAHANADVQQMLLQVEENITEKNAMKANKDELEKTKLRLEDCIAELQTQRQNLKNDFLAARSEIMILETQLGKERDKMVKLREDKKHLIEKVHTNEELVATKITTIQRLQVTNKEMEIKLTSELEQRKKAECEKQALTKAMNQLQEKQKKLEEDLRTFLDQRLQLRQQIETREEQNGALQKTVQDQQIEIRELQKRISELEKSWGSRAMGIATMFARVPLSILQNMVLIFLPQNN